MKKNGFSLIEVMIVAAIFGFISLAIGKLIIEQQKSITYFEERMEKIQLTRTLETILSDQQACHHSLSGLQIPNQNATIQIANLKDNLGRAVVRSNQKDGRLNIGQITLINQTLVAPLTSGLVDIIVPVNRTGTGGGPSHFKPLQHKVRVRVNSSNVVIGCASNNGVEVIEAGGPADGQTGHQACQAIGKTCSYLIGFSNITGDMNCPSATHCMRVCMTWYNQSLPGVPNSNIGVGTTQHNNIHSCDARVGFYTTYNHPGVVICGTYFSAICQ
jgi:prepilin-type N-terminal cleavage/methylation domain-containing protein